jgi:hypothetical protein
VAVREDDRGSAWISCLFFLFFFFLFLWRWLERRRWLQRRLLPRLDGAHVLPLALQAGEETDQSEVA